MSEAVAAEQNSQADIVTSETAGTLRIARALWPLLLATFVYTMPLVALSVFVGAMAADLETGASVIGGMRAIVGVAALGVGFFLTPLIDRAPRALIVSAGLLLGALADLFAVSGSLAALAVFNALLGASMAMLLPAVQAASADRFHGPASGRAVSMITSCQAVANIASGPLLALPAMVAGWRAAFVAVAVLAAVTAAIAALTLPWRRPPNVSRLGYRQSFATVARAPGALPLLLASLLRSGAWFAWVTYLAAFFTDEFGATTTLVAWVWFVGAGTFLVGNILTGRLVNAAVESPAMAWRSPERLLTASVLANVAFAPLVFVSPTVPTALVGTALFCATNAALLTSLMSLLIRRYTPMRGAVMGLNGVGTNVGMIVGISSAGAALGIGGYVGVAATLMALALLTLVAVFYAVRVLNARIEHSAESPVIA